MTKPKFKIGDIVIYKDNQRKIIGAEYIGVYGPASWVYRLDGYIFCSEHELKLIEEI